MRSHTCALLLLLIIALGLNGCGKTKDPRESSSSSGAVLRFKKVSCIDKAGIGCEAFSVLIPSDWKFEGSIAWVLDNPGTPATAHIRIYNPGGLEEVEVFPTQPFFWTTNPMLRSMFPVGSRYFGNEVRSPVGSVEALRQIVIPRFRKKVAGFRVIDQQTLPSLAAALGNASRLGEAFHPTSDGAKIRFEYRRGGCAIEEELYGLVESYSIPVRTMTGMASNIMWAIDYLFSFKAEKGSLDGQAKLFQTVVYSFKINPQWFARYTQVVQYLIRAQIEHIRSVGELSRIISRTSSEISDQMLQSYYQRQEVYDNVAKNFSQTIRGVDEYYDPVEQKSVELPAGFTNGWTNSLGEYVLSESEDFNPNIGSNLNWQKMERK